MPGRDWPEPQKGHAAMITRMDADIGRLLAKLKELGLDQKTIVFFTSDNGPHKEGGADPSSSTAPARCAASSARCTTAGSACR